MGTDESRAIALIIQFKDMEKRNFFLPMRRALKGNQLYSDDNLTLAQVAHDKENIPGVYNARKEGK